MILFRLWRDANEEQVSPIHPRVMARDLHDRDKSNPIQSNPIAARLECLVEAMHITYHSRFHTHTSTAPYCVWDNRSIARVGSLLCSPVALDDSTQQLYFRLCWSTRLGFHFIFLLLLQTVQKRNFRIEVYLTLHAPRPQVATTAPWTFGKENTVQGSKYLHDNEGRR